MLKSIKKRIWCVAITVAMIVTILPTTAFAATSKTVTGLPWAAGSTLYNGYIYTVKSNMTITAGASGNALTVSAGSTVVIDIAPGYTLTVNGGNGSGQNAGGAGIYLPSNSTLIITGGGRLIANGGASGTPGYGGNSGSVGRYGSDYGNYSGVTFYAGTGGGGGAGGGGAGAGIGTSGGAGGGGGGGGAGSSISYTTDSSGGTASAGNAGSATASMGALYVLGNAVVTANAGAMLSNLGYAGGISHNSRIYYHTDWTRYQTLGAGGGGGGGGQGGSANAIGSGGSGGGGGGGGSGGGTYYFNYRNNVTNVYNGNGGGGGSSYASSGYGGYAATHSQINYYDGNSSAGDRSYAGRNTYGNSGSGIYGGSATSYARAGGNGGNAGSKGSSGIVYKSPTATISGRTNDYTVATHNAVSSTVSFDTQEGAGGTQSLTATYGSAMGNISLPTLELFAFMGYYTSTNGQGTRYFDHRGVPTTNYYRTEDIKLYAYWVQQQFNVTLNPQSGIGGATSLITAGIDGSLPSGIVMPTRENYQFNGYFQKAAGQGLQYYNANGQPTNNKITVNSSIYASWTQLQYPIYFNQQGGSNGTANIWTISNDGTLPDIAIPVRTGFVFGGYFDDFNGRGTKCYNSDGTTTGQKLTATANTLYAYWTPDNYAINYELGGGNNGSSNPVSRSYAQIININNPTKSGYTFIGWTIDNGQKTYQDLVIPAGNTAYAKDLTLTAKWLLGNAGANETDAIIDAQINGEVANAAEIKETLKGVFRYIVDQDDKGITAQDMAGDKSIKLVMTVSTSQSQEDETNISGTAQGTVLKFYDLKVEKQVTDSTGKTVSTNLTELPVPITVQIPASGELGGKTSYSVYRVHGSTTEKLPTQAGTNGEASDYDLGSGNIVITTRKFSTYGIVGAETSFGNTPGSSKIEHSGQGVDVQGRVIEADGGKVYKIDIAWGAMVFEYSLNQEWDPEAHMYTEGALNNWRHQNFDGKNNKVTAVNHSNGDVKVNFSVISLLSGVATSLHMYNESTAEKANHFILSDAPVGSVNADLVPCSAFLFLEGPPTNEWINVNKEAYVKAGLITVTVESYPDP